MHITSSILLLLTLFLSLLILPSFNGYKTKTLSKNKLRFLQSDWSNYQETQFQSGLDYLSLFYPPNSPNNNLFYTAYGSQNGLFVLVSSYVSNNDNQQQSAQLQYGMISNIIYPNNNDDLFYVCFEDDSNIWTLPASLNPIDSVGNYVSHGTGKGLKCFVDSTESYMFIAYLGSNSIFKLELLPTPTFSSLYSFNDGDQILTFASSGDRIVNPVFYIMRQNTSSGYYYLNILDYAQYPSNKEYSYKIADLSLYSIVEISVIRGSGYILVFSYSQSTEITETTVYNFNYFVIDPLTGKILRKQTQGNLFNLTNVTIYYFKFIENTELFMYRIMINNNQYFGIGNLDLSMMIFNKGEAVNRILYMKDKPSNSVIYISYNKNLYKINCPFILDDSGLCVLKCSDPTKGIIVNTNGNSCSTCSGNNPYSYNGIYCLSKCPIGTYISLDGNNVCIPCSMFISNTSNPRCVPVCPDYYGYDENNYCFKCSDKGMFYDTVNKICIESCPSNYVIGSNKECINCKDNQQYFCGSVDNCCTTCPPLNVPDSNNVCSSCKSPNLYYLNSLSQTPNAQCVSNCPINAEVDTDNYVCKICKEQNPAQYLNKITKTCDSSCPDYYLYDDQNVCYNCKDSGYFYNGSCVKPCPNGSVQDDINYKCTICGTDVPNKPYIYQNSCVENCPINYLYDNSNTCYSCKDNSVNKYLYGNSCTSSCPKGSKIDDTNYLCTLCQENKQYLYNNDCVDKCPDNYLYDENNSCYMCKDTNQFLYNGSCMQSCPPGSKIDQNNICTVCKEQGLYLYQNTCIAKCSENYLYDSDNICYTCKERYGNYYDLTSSTCVDKCCDYSVIDTTNNICECCPNYAQLDQVNMACISCKANGEYLNKNKVCSQSCDDNYLYDQDNICYSCKSDFDPPKFLLSKECVPSCPDTTSIDYTNNICTLCNGPNGNYLYDGECVTSCPTNYLADPSGKCYSCQEENKYLYQNQCWNSCPVGCYIDTNNFVCNCCFDNKMFLLEDSNQCVDKCPDNYLIQPGSVCHSCKSEGKYFFNNGCVQSCPDYASIDEVNKICISCLANGLYLSDNQCVKNCDLYSIVLPNNICYNCKQNNNQYYLDKKTTSMCTSDCPTYATKDMDKMVCTSCLDYNQWLFNNNCIDNCQYCKQENNVCVYCNECQANNTIKLGSGCVTNCPDGYKQNDINECISCKDLTSDNTTFYYNDDCVNTCPDGFIYDTNNICSACDFILNNNCLPACPYPLGRDDKTKICIECSSKGEYFYNGLCYDTCPDGTSQDNVNFICKSNIIIQCFGREYCSNNGECDAYQ